MDIDMLMMMILKQRAPVCGSCADGGPYQCAQSEGLGLQAHMGSISHELP